MNRVTKTCLVLALGCLLNGCGAGEDPAGVTPGPWEKRTVVAAGPAYEANPVVSPDGRWVYYESDADGDLDLYRVSVAGGDAEQLTHNRVFDSAPSVSPDGCQLVYESDLSGSRHLYILDLATPQASPRALTFAAGEDGSPDWSPAGQAIVFESNRDKMQGTDLYVIKPDGAGLHRLTMTPEMAYCRTADWSPDGTHLVYESNASGWSALYTTTATGREACQITVDAGYEGHPAWSPGGDRIAFESTRDGASQIYSVKPEGGSWTQLTLRGGYWPQWTADGLAIVYGIFDGQNANVVEMPVQ